MSYESERRKTPLKDYAQLIMLALAIAGILWRGGQFTQELAQITLTVTKIDARQENSATQQAQDRADLRVLQERFIGLTERVGRLESVNQSKGAR